MAGAVPARAATSYYLYPCTATAYSKATGERASQAAFYVSLDRDTPVALGDGTVLTLRMQEVQVNIDAFAQVLSGRASGRSSFLRQGDGETVFGNDRVFGWVRCQGALPYAEAYLLGPAREILPADGPLDGESYLLLTRGACVVGDLQVAARAMKSDWMFPYASSLRVEGDAILWDEVVRECVAYSDDDSYDTPARSCLQYREISRTSRKLLLCQGR